MSGTETPASRTIPRSLVVLWLVQPVSILLEVLVAAFVSVPYSFRDNTISDLGAATCTSVNYPTGPVSVCSPAHTVLNAGFILAGAALVGAAVLLLRSTTRSRLVHAACILWIISGVSSVATGLIPLDTNMELHALVSTPAILLQPVALALHAAAYTSSDSRWWPLVGVGALTTAAALLFLLRLDTEWGGLIERATIWPALLALPFLGLQAARSARHASADTQQQVRESATTAAI